ncbi:uncharacterized protein EV420DRAFT_1076335 [Desarmillaria tabescens]|uniref:DUF6534 domain-containing protein n=1 Tax=Armillaria tabescens TaxID=1929756 RepID=A0AA39JH14_ARMTA|nr:uncharacterized protein EV420DRAFT_1076335 [Desarmillaria tabescens]KAK0442493.1 hypothetical protein EV420DRAFT_1076335 [Desarmillaria tabescens]
MSTHAVYHYVVDTFGNYEEIYNIIWSFKLQILLSMVIIVGVQAIYAIRIWKLGRHFNKIIPWFVVLTVAAAFGAGIFSVYAEYTISSFLSISRIKASTCVVFSVPAISDFIIAFAMCYYLHKCREASEFASTSAMVLRLMRLVVVSGLATSACSLLTLITYLVWPNTLIFLGVDLVLPKFYINSLLVMLNFRPDHRTAARSHSSELRVLRFAPRDSRSDVDEVSISIPMENIQSLEHTK